MSAPVLYESSWIVWATNKTYGGASREPSWCWAAYGPRGSNAGVEDAAETAARKAASAMYLLSDGRNS